MIDEKIGKNCTGCEACVNICSLEAVKMVPDNEGFYYPRVDSRKCVSCGKCLTSCPVLNPLKPETAAGQEEVYAAWNTDPVIRTESTSGGVFTALAQAVISRGGHVVGAYYDEYFCIRHGVVSTKEELGRLRQSKYAQSRIGDVYRAVKKLLNAGEMVLFCGTPCQVSGLQKYLGRVYENLYCCDFICRGVISPKVYRKFLQDMKPDSSVAVQKVHFKNKDYGWNRFSTKLTFQDGTVYQKDRDADYYMRGYLKHNLYLRPSCHRCAFKTLPRVSDISLGDFWGIGKYDPALDNEMGTSVVLVNSEKGRVLLGWAAEALVLSRRRMEEVTAGNSCLLNSAPEGEYRTYFFENMDRYQFGALIEKIDRMSAHIKTTDRMLQWMHRVKGWITGEVK